MERGKSFPLPGAFGGGVEGTKEESPAQQSTPARTATPHTHARHTRGSPGTHSPEHTSVPAPGRPLSLALGLGGPGCNPWRPKHTRGSPRKDGPTAAVTDTRERGRLRCGQREPPGSRNRSLVAPPAVRIAQAARPGAPGLDGGSVCLSDCLPLPLRGCHESHCPPPCPGLPHRCHRKELFLHLTGG